MNGHKATYTIADLETGDGYFTVGGDGPFDFDGAMAVLTKQAGRPRAGARDRLYDAMGRAMTRACGRHVDVGWNGPFDAEFPFQWGYVCYVEKSAAMIPTDDPQSAYRAAREHLAVCAGPSAGRQP